MAKFLYYNLQRKISKPLKHLVVSILQPINTFLGLFFFCEKMLNVLSNCSKLKMENFFKTLASINRKNHNKVEITDLGGYFGIYSVELRKTKSKMTLLYLLYFCLSIARKDTYTLFFKTVKHIDIEGKLT